MTDLPETSELLAFARAVEAGSLSGAALELGLPRVTVSRRLARLEERLGVRLLRRSTRRLTLTDAGEELYRHARVVLSAVRDADGAVRRTDGAVRGLLRVALPPGPGPWLHDMLLAFLTRYPDVRLEALYGTAHVDLIAAGYDVAIRASSDLDPWLVARTLARVRVMAVASPAYLSRVGTPQAPGELMDHKCLVGFTRGERPATHWPLEGGGAVRVEGIVVSNDITLLQAAALAGVGIALLPEILVAEHLAAGRLVHVLADRVGARTLLAIVYPEREFLPPAVRAFVDFVAAWGVESIATLPVPDPPTRADGVVAAAVPAPRDPL
ncbi:MAG: LysR family transcriptional regulator [Pseudomonadota bacterium]|nr:LysR family transcriptional regulator [Pseudomonadota bacterium]